MELRHKNLQENKLLAAVLFVFFVNGVTAQSLGPLIPFLRQEYGLSYDISGVMLSCQSVGNLAAVTLSGFLPALMGRRRTVLCLGIWLAVGLAILSAGLGGGAILPLACLMMGLAKGSCVNFSNTMISTLPGNKSAVGYNLLHGAFAVGALLAPLVLLACTGSNDTGWKLMSWGLLVLSLVQLLVYLRMPLPEEHSTGKKRGTDRSFLKNRSFWLGSMILFCYISAEYAITGWLVTYFQDIGTLPGELSQMMSSLLWLVIFIGRMVGALAVGRISRKKLLIIDGIGLLAFFLLVFFSQTTAAIIVGIAGMGLFMATIYPSAVALGTDSIRGNDLGVSAMILSGSIGGILTPAAVGFVAEFAGIHAGMGVVVGMTVLLLIAIVISVLSGD